MTQDGLHIDEASLRNLKVNIEYFKGYVMGMAKDGLKRFGMRIVAKAKKTLKDNGNIAQGLLRNSGRTVVQPDGTVDAGFYVGYAEFVEYGRASGKMPPMDVIYQWINRKNIEPKVQTVTSDENEEKRKERAVQKRERVIRKKRDKMSKDERAKWSLAYLIARHIGEYGTKPHPFLKPAYDEYRTQIGQFMQQTIDQAVEQFKPKK